MKAILFFMFIILIACKNTINVEPGTDPALSWQLIVAFIAGVYEVAARLIPTVKNYSLIAKIIEVLVWLSNRFNVKKK